MLAFIKKMIKLALFAFAGLAAVILMFVVQFAFPNIYKFDPKLWTFDIRLRNADSPFYLKDLTTFTWEKVCFIGSYESHESIQKLIGEEYKLGPIDTGDDGLTNLLFGLSDKTTIAVVVPREFFEINHRQDCLNYQSAEIFLFNIPQKR